MAQFIFYSNFLQRRGSLELLKHWALLLEHFWFAGFPFSFGCPSQPSSNLKLLACFTASFCGLGMAILLSIHLSMASFQENFERPYSRRHENVANSWHVCQCQFAVRVTEVDGEGSMLMVLGLEGVVVHVVVTTCELLSKPVNCNALMMLKLS